MKITSGDAQVTGVALEAAANLVLTTSISLGASPLVTVKTEGGQTHSGWIVGRDDAKDLALVRIVDGGLKGIPFAAALSPKPGDELLLVWYPKDSASASTREVAVATVRSDQASSLLLISTGDTAAFGNGTFIVGSDIEPGTYRNSDSSANCYWARLRGFSGEAKDVIASNTSTSIQIVTVAQGDLGFVSERCGAWSPVATTPTAVGMEGGTLFTRDARVMGIRTGDSFVAYNAALATVITELANGAVSLTAARPTPTPNPSSPPPGPVIVKGKATVSGAPVRTGAVVYARLFGPSLLEVWFSAPVREGGAFDMVIGVVNPAYTSGTIEFYLEAVKSSTTVAYRELETLVVEAGFP